MNTPDKSVRHFLTLTDLSSDEFRQIIARAIEEGVSAQEVAERNITKLHEAIEAMHMLPATHYPRATEHIVHTPLFFASGLDLLANGSGGRCQFNWEGVSWRTLSTKIG